MASFVLRVRRGGELLGSFELGPDAVEFSVVDESGTVVACFSATGGAPADDGPSPMVATPLEATLDADTITDGVSFGQASGGSHDEVPVGGTVDRFEDDDFTMPLPEMDQTDSITDALGEAAETEEDDLSQRLGRSKPRPIPNLAAQGDLDLDTITGPVGPATKEHEISLLTDTGSDTPIARVLRMAKEQSGEVEIDDLDLEGLLEETASEVTLPEPEEDAPAEVWVRRDARWLSGGSLRPGQRAVSRGGWVRLRRDGWLVVRPGPSLAGSATLADGTAMEIMSDMAPLELPAGTSVLLRAGEHGLYVRSGGSEPAQDG